MMPACLRLVITSARVTWHVGLKNVAFGLTERAFGSDGTFERPASSGSLSVSDSSRLRESLEALDSLVSTVDPRDPVVVEGMESE